jgi:riboflavin synthase
VFTGLVSDVGSVVALEKRNDILTLQISSKYDPAGIADGASIACAGICLTVVDCHASQSGDALFTVEAASETQALTSVGGWQVGTRINLERPLRLGDELGGHLMSGHVDDVATITAREARGDAVRFGFRAPAHLARFIAGKGSVALDGTSLTVNSVMDNEFDCLIIPHTLKVTTWADRKTGDAVNLEVDTIARYVARLSTVPAGT